MSDPSVPTQEDEVQIHFERSPYYRIVHADGAWGGLTAQLGVHVAFYAEFREPPESITYAIVNNSPTERRRAGREAVVRHVEVEVAFNLNTATQLRDWLNEKLKDAERAIAETGVTLPPDVRE